MLGVVHSNPLWMVKSVTVRQVSRRRCLRFGVVISPLLFIILVWGVVAIVVEMNRRSSGTGKFIPSSRESKVPPHRIMMMMMITTATKWLAFSLPSFCLPIYNVRVDNCPQLLNSTTGLRMDFRLCDLRPHVRPTLYQLNCTDMGSTNTFIVRMLCVYVSVCYTIRKETFIL